MSSTPHLDEEPDPVDEPRSFPPLPPTPDEGPDAIANGPERSTKARRAGTVAAGVVLALGAGGVAYAAGSSGATATPRGYGAEGANGYGAPGGGPGGGHLGGRGGFGFGLGGGVLHGEATVKDGDSATKTVFVQQGSITAITATSLTVKSTDGFSKTYVLDADTKKLTPDTLAVNDTVGVLADVAGSTATATRVVEQGAKPAAGSETTPGATTPGATTPGATTPGEGGPGGWGGHRGPRNGTGPEGGTATPPSTAPSAAPSTSGSSSGFVPGSPSTGGTAT
jgi:hypothetical protein